MAEEAFQILPYPARGVDVGGPLQAQPPLTTPEGVNVRAFDTFAGRDRGGSRAGLSKYLPGRVSGAAAVQDLNLVVSTSAAALGAVADPTGNPVGLPGYGGGGYQPGAGSGGTGDQSGSSGLSLLADYDWTAGGFTLTLRLLRQGLARSAALSRAGSILGALAHPPAYPLDFPDPSDNYQAHVAAVDQLGNPVGLNGSDFTTVPLDMHNTGSLYYLGRPATEYDWTKAYDADPGATTYTVTVTLLDRQGSRVRTRDSAGTLGADYVSVSFGASSSPSPGQGTIGRPGLPGTAATLSQYALAYGTIAGSRGVRWNDFNSGPQENGRFVINGTGESVSDHLNAYAAGESDGNNSAYFGDNYYITYLSFYHPVEISTNPRWLYRPQSVFTYSPAGLAGRVVFGSTFGSLAAEQSLSVLAASATSAEVFGSGSIDVSYLYGYGSEADFRLSHGPDASPWPGAVQYVSGYLEIINGVRQSIRSTLRSLAFALARTL